MSRDAARRLTSSFRDNAITCNDKKRKELLRSLTILVTQLAAFIAAADDDDDDDDDLLELLAVLLMAIGEEYQSLIVARVPRRRLNFDHITIETFPIIKQNWKSTFGFRKRDIYQLLELLQLPEVVHLVNGYAFSWEELLLFSLFRYRSADELDRSDIIFKRD